MEIPESASQSSVPRAPEPLFDARCTCARLSGQIGVYPCPVHPEMGAATFAGSGPTKCWCPDKGLSIPHPYPHPPEYRVVLACCGGSTSPIRHRPDCPVDGYTPSGISARRIAQYEHDRYEALSLALFRLANVIDEWFGGDVPAGLQSDWRYVAAMHEVPK